MEMGLEVYREEVELDSLVDSVPQTPWDFSLFDCSSSGIRAGQPSEGRPPGPSAVCRLQIGAQGCVPAEPLSSAGAKGVLPISVSFRVYRAGNGKRQF